jgi:Fe-S-cluster containining protein
MLDRERGACLVYDARPIACRTYGFYTERDAGLHCSMVTNAVDAHAAREDPASGPTPVVWGNGEAIAADMDAFGKPASLREWLRQ